MKTTNYVVLFFISSAVLVLTFLEIKPISSALALLLPLWALTPWLYALGLVFFVTHPKKLVVILIVMSILGIFGIWGFIDANYVHIDPQSSLVFVFIPLWQLVAFFVATPFLSLFKKS